MSWRAILPVEYTAELKLDGLSIALHYDAAEDGGARLAHGLTRGDGQMGEDVTTNIRTIRSVPLRCLGGQQLKKAECAAGVRGARRGRDAENGVSQDGTRSASRRARFSAVNPSNAAAGAIRTKDPRNRGAGGGCDVYAYFLLSGGEYVDMGQEATLDALTALGFRVNPHRGRMHKVEEMMQVHRRRQRNAAPRWATTSMAWCSKWTRRRRSSGWATRAARRDGRWPTSSPPSRRSRRCTTS